MARDDSFCGCELTDRRRVCDGQSCPCCAPKPRAFAYVKLRAGRVWLVAYALVMLFFTAWAMPGAMQGEAFEQGAIFVTGWLATVLVALAFVASITREDHRQSQRIGLSWLGAWAGMSCVVMAGLLGVLADTYWM